MNKPVSKAFIFQKIFGFWLNLNINVSSYFLFQNYDQIMARYVFKAFNSHSIRFSALINQNHCLNRKINIHWVCVLGLGIDSPIHS